MWRVDPSLVGTAREPLASVLYRYWFWDWLFRDVNLGDPLRRHASRRHNQAMRGWLPTYMGRWLVCTTATTVVAQSVEAATAPAVVPAIFYTGAVLGSIVCTLAAILWAFLAHERAG